MPEQKSLEQSWKTLEGIDWDLLHKQKLALVELAMSDRLIPVECEHLEGVINLLDNLGDEAERRGLFVYPENPEEEEDSPSR